MEIQDIAVGERTVTRRTFIKGVIAAGATVSSSSYLFRGATKAYAQSASGTAERLITLNVNGQNRPVDVNPQETLAQVLRYKLGLTGTKYGCDRAECGACTVLVDGVTQYSCSLLAHQVRGRAVTTIEGLESPERRPPSRAAGGHGDIGVPVRVLLLGLHHGHGRHDQPEPEPHTGRDPTVAFGQPLPVRGLRQDSDVGAARSRVEPRHRVTYRVNPRPDTRDSFREDSSREA
jgi:hypothetical protein